MTSELLKKMRPDLGISGPLEVKSQLSLPLSNIPEHDSWIEQKPPMSEMLTQNSPVLPPLDPLNYQRIMRIVEKRYQVPQSGKQSKK